MTFCSSCRFPPAATSFILQQFSQYGNIIKHTVSICIILRSCPCWGINPWAYQLLEEIQCHGPLYPSVNSKAGLRSHMGYICNLLHTPTTLKSSREHVANSPLRHLLLWMWPKCTSEAPNVSYFSRITPYFKTFESPGHPSAETNSGLPNI
jgi:hypothetical protein